MKNSFLYIISIFLLSVFVIKETVSDIRLISTIDKELCENCNQNEDQTSFEKENKLVSNPITLNVLLKICNSVNSLYRTIRISALAPKVITPPPERYSHFLL